MCLKECAIQTIREAVAIGSHKDPIAIAAVAEAVDILAQLITNKSDGKK